MGGFGWLGFGHRMGLVVSIPLVGGRRLVSGLLAQIWLPLPGIDLGDALCREGIVRKGCWLGRQHGTGGGGQYIRCILGRGQLDRDPGMVVVIMVSWVRKSLVRRSAASLKRGGDRRCS
ncbi:hypothetical protein LZ32DRAFT_29989 [Colletotrichum eremochloae]|nr:hypothetical protein LZ32DRAFT_29989 [Colletotrichum eremochloae]